MASSIAPLFIKGTSKSPEIDFNPSLLLVSGRSILEDPIEFYQPIIAWIEDYIKQPEALTRVIFRLEYINSGSNRLIYNILKLLDGQYQKGSNMVVNWYYEEDDDTLYNLGLDLQGLVKLPFKLLVIGTN